MSGTSEGARKAAETNKERYGKDFFARIGAKGNESYMSQPKEYRQGRGYASKKVGKDGLTGAQRAKISGVKGGSVGRKK